VRVRWGAAGRSDPACSLAVLVNVANAPGGGVEVRAVKTAARMLGLEIIVLEIRRADEIEPAIEELNGKAGAVYVVQDPLFIATRDRINTLVLSARLPTMHAAREFVEAGGLMSHGASFPDTFRRAADYVDKILRGAKPGDLPIEQPTKFEFVLNQTTAKALGSEQSGQKDIPGHPSHPPLGRDFRPKVKSGVLDYCGQKQRPTRANGTDCQSRFVRIVGHLGNDALDHGIPPTCHLHDPVPANLVAKLRRSLSMHSATTTT
jgi:hypothetical protein